MAVIAAASKDDFAVVSYSINSIVALLTVTATVTMNGFLNFRLVDCFVFAVVNYVANW